MHCKKYFFHTLNDAWTRHCLYETSNWTEIAIRRISFETYQANITNSDIDDKLKAKCVTETKIEII